MLTLYIHGLNPDCHNFQTKISKILKIFDLKKWKHIQAKNLSGGTKRKLNSAIAFLGNPNLVLLDEPTAGLDPAARSQLWKNLNKLKSKGCGLVLTSHSVAECESVCNRIGIMAKGKLLCIGTPDEILDEFGQGYIVDIKICLNSIQLGRGQTPNQPGQVLDPKLLGKNLQINQNLENLLNFVRFHLGAIEIIDQQQKFLKIKIGHESKNLSPLPTSQVVKIFTGLKNDSKILDFSIHRVTLDDIFVKFARNFAATK